MRLASDLNDDLSYLDASDIITVTLTGGDNEFTLQIDNVSGDSAFSSPITPVVWVVHSDMMDDDMMGDDMMDDDDESMDDDKMGTSGVFFTSGHTDYGQGLEALAEDGNPAILFTTVGGTDFVTPITPVVWAVHDGMMDGGAFFTIGEADRGQGLEHVAEDGNPATLIESLQGMELSSSGCSLHPLNATEAGPALPGGGYEFTITGSPGEVFSFVTMFVESNDLFFGSETAGINLFDADGNPLSPDVTSHVWLWDAGTEVNEEPGAGANQPLRQAGPDTGDDEMGVVQLAADTGDGFSYLPVASLIRVIIHPDDMMIDG